MLTQHWNSMAMQGWWHHWHVVDNHHCVCPCSCPPLACSYSSTLSTFPSNAMTRCDGTTVQWHNNVTNDLHYVLLGLITCLTLQPHPFELDHSCPTSTMFSQAWSLVYHLYQALSSHCIYSSHSPLIFTIFHWTWLPAPGVWPLSLSGITHQPPSLPLFEHIHWPFIFSPRLGFSPPLATTITGKLPVWCRCLVLYLCAHCHPALAHPPHPPSLQMQWYKDMVHPHPCPCMLTLILPFPIPAHPPHLPFKCDDMGTTWWGNALA